MSCQNWNIELFPPKLSAEEEAELFAQMEHGSLSARHKLIMHNMRLVMLVVKEFNCTGVERDDMISCGMIGLIKAVDSFRRNEGTKFSTYAMPCIRNEIRFRFFKPMSKTDKDVFFDDIAEDDNGKCLTIEDVLVDPANVESAVDWRLSKEKVVELVDTVLSPRQREVIIRRYGLDGKEPMTQVNLAAEFGITYSGVGNAERLAIQKLARYFWGK